MFLNSYGDSHDRVSFAYEVMACSVVSAAFDTSESASALELLTLHNSTNLYLQFHNYANSHTRYNLVWEFHLI